MILVNYLTNFHLQKKKFLNPFAISMSQMCTILSVENERKLYENVSLLFSFLKGKNLYIHHYAISLGTQENM